VPKKTGFSIKTSRTAAQNARAELPRLAEAYFAAGRKLLARKPSGKALHKFRLETKRFRYTLELFRPCYGPGLDVRLARLGEVQTHLGDINDCATALRMLKDEDALNQKALSKYLDRRAKKKIGEFLKCWKTSMDSRGQQAWWVGYLARFARPGA
jgi:CHAD domain-containing protein